MICTVVYRRTGLMLLLLLCSPAFCQNSSNSPAHSAFTPIVSGRGCGAHSGGAKIYDQSTCGNYSGAPYEDLATASPVTPPKGSHQKISACTMIVPAAGDVFRFTGDVNDGAGGTNQKCIWFRGQGANNFVIDLAGFTLTGGIKCDQTAGGHDCSGITVVNGTINCNIANGGLAACLSFNQSNNPSQSILLSHLTIANSNSPENKDSGYSGFQFAAVLIANGKNQTSCVPGAFQRTFNRACLEAAHLTVSNAYGYSGAGYPPKGWCARCTDLYFAGAGGVTVDAWNNILNNGAMVDANQGIVCFNTGPCSMRNNYAPWVAYTGKSNTGRAFLFDSAGKDFNQAGGQVSGNYVAVFNNRAVRTRQVNNIIVRDNLFENIQSSTIESCIMMGGNGDYVEKIDGNRVEHNTFIMGGGTAIEAAESYGMIADGNTFTCGGNCSTGILAGAWLAEGENGLTYGIKSASRTPACVVTLNLNYSPTTSSVITGKFVNVSGTGTDFDVTGTAGNSITSRAGSSITYTQAGCAGAGTIAAAAQGSIFWMSHERSDNYPANGAQIYVKNSIVDPLLTMPQPFVACGTANPACLNPPMPGQSQISWCNNRQDSKLLPAVGGAGATVIHRTPDSQCP